MTEQRVDATAPWSDGDDPDGGGLAVAYDDGLELVPNDPDGLTVDITTPLTTDQAKELTETIRSTSEVLFVLLARAHAGKAWIALGYSSFADYVHEEFDMSRSRAYQILDQAKVVAAIESAAPDGAELPNISEAAARDLKSIIGEVVPEIAARTADLPANEAGAVVEEIVEDYREKVKDKREQDALDAEERELDAAERRGFSDTGSGGIYTPPPAPTYDDDDDDFDPALIRRNVQAAYDLYSALSACKAMPDVESVINTIPVERRVQINESLPLALNWLIEFKNGWFAQPWQEGNDAVDPADDDSIDDDSDEPGPLEM